MRARISWKSLCFSLIISMLLFLQLNNKCLAAGATTTFSVTGTYYQDEARSMLKMINDYRTSGNAWYYDENEKKHSTGKLKAYTYDYNLEQIAIQRAMEISVYYSHERPDGTMCFTCEYNGFKTNGENIAYASYDASAAEAYDMWLETNYSHEGQGHRRQMLDPYHTRIGIACVERDGCRFWVQEFASGTNSSSKTNALNGKATKSVKILNEYMRYSLGTYDGYDALNMKYGDTYPASQIVENLSTASFLNVEPPFWSRAANKLSSSDTSVVSVGNGVITANKVGSTTLKATASSGKTISMMVNVIAARISGFNTTIAFDKDEYIYEGQPVEPKVTVTLDGRTLVQGTDYTVTYKNNTSAGFGTATVTGTGNYTGSVSDFFLIRKPSKSSDKAQNSSKSNTKKNNQDKSGERSQQNNKQATYGDSSRKVYKNITYSLKGSTATVTGYTKRISSFTAPSSVIFDGKTYRVTAIANGAFIGLTSLKKVDLSKAGVTAISKNAFSGCTALKSVKISAAMTKKVKGGAFKDVNSKAKVTILSKDKKSYSKLVKALKKAGLKNASYKMK